MSSTVSEGNSTTSVYDRLAIEVSLCRKCDLWVNRVKPVIGEGPLDTTIVMVGLGPGRRENIEGRPFVGLAGRFLDEFLSSIGIERSRIYITNIVKCYPPGNRVYRRHVERCTPYLEEQLRVIEPKIILALGNVAAAYFSEKYKVRLLPMNRMHGAIVETGLDYPKYIIPMYHPASACYNPRMKRVISEDWRRISPLL
ncbi:MAG: uracil-DNA glycosylase, partial [Candidatus Bathyarchaeota archaeon]|nr:uracil-DNA glycosylase [Candidatus Bathyarchaeota archaeon]